MTDIPRARMLIASVNESLGHPALDEALGLMTRKINKKIVRRGKGRVTQAHVDAVMASDWQNLTSTDIALRVFGDACAAGRVSEIINGRKADAIHSS